MISFIVIGRNEGWKLSTCLQSIQIAIRVNQFPDREILYVDSSSTDDSVELAKGIEGVRVFLITGEFNAAVARNIGAKESKGDVLFFIDGDMEIRADFIPLVYSDSTGLSYPFVSGNWINHHYDDFRSRDSVSTHEKVNMSRDEFQVTTGGLFMIRRDVWFEAGGMNTRYRRSQDWELGLRLADLGVKLLRKKEILADHHTISPRLDNRRTWHLTLSGAKFYRAVMLRDHLLNRHQWSHFLKTNYTFIIFLLGLIITFLTGSGLGLLLYPIAILARSVRRKQLRASQLLTNLATFMLYEIGFLFALLFFWPKEVELQYREVTNE